MCNFKAKELLELRRMVAKNQTLTMAELGHVLRMIDDARWRHAEVSGCNCWEEARSSDPSEFDKREAA